MSGTNTKVKKATQLKSVADSKHETTNKEKRDRIYNHLIAAAETEAANGRYSKELYDEALGEPTMIPSLKKMFEEDGFKVEGGLDSNYTDHAGTDMWYIRISW